MDILDEVEGKAVIWSHYQKDVQRIISEIKKKNVLYLPNIDAGKPSFVEFLRLEIINSLNKINDKDQKGIKLFLQRKVKGIK